MSFIDLIKSRAKSNPKTIVLPEAYDKRVLTAANQVLSEEIAKIILIGSKDEIIKNAEGMDLSKAVFIDPRTYDKSEEYVNQLFELRKSKGMTLEEAGKLIYEDELYFGIMLVKTGVADGMVAGAVRSTPDVLSPCVRVLKTSPNSKIVSSVFVMCVPDCQYGHNGIFVYGDCGMNQNPDAETLAYIAVNSAKTFKSLVGAEPVVAMLSNSTMGSTKNDDVQKVVDATKIAKEMAPDIIIDGEFQADAAIVKEIGNQKAPGSAVAGNANVLIFPDLQSGNIGYKLTERLAKASAYGPVTAGIAKPVNDLSRGCTADDIIGVVAITAVQAHNPL